MKHPISEDNTYKKTLVLTIEQQPYDVEVTATQWGEVLDTEIPLLALPETAQRLIMGVSPDGYQASLNRLVSLTELIRYKLPLALLGYLKEDSYAVFPKVNEALIQTKKWESDINDEWVKTLYRFYLRKDSKNDKCFDILSELLKIEPVINLANFEYLVSRKFTPLSPIIPKLILSLSNNSLINKCYSALKVFPTPEHRQFLIQHFKDETRKPFLRYIIEGLAGYARGDKEIYALAMDYYEQSSDINSSEVSALFLVFTKCETKKIKEIAYEALLSNNTTISYAALKLLKSQGYSEVRIIKQLNSVLDKPVDNKQLLPAIRVYNHISTPNLPNPTKLIKLSLSVVKSHWDPGLIYAVSELLIRNYTTSIDSKIFALLESDNPNIQKAGIFFIAHIKSKVRQFSLTDKALTRLLGIFIAEENQGIVTQILNIISNISSAAQLKQCILLQLDKIQKSTDMHIIEKAMRNINLAFWHEHREPIIIPYYLEKLNHPNGQIKIMAIQGLQYHQDMDERIKPALEALKKNATPHLLQILGQQPVGKITAAKINRAKAQPAIQYVAETDDRTVIRIFILVVLFILFLFRMILAISR